MELVLYKRDTCPYCVKVMRCIEQSGRDDVAYADITADPAARETLVNVGGKQQVPCLFIDGKPLYESDDIIAWLSQHPQE